MGVKDEEEEGYVIRDEAMLMNAATGIPPAANIINQPNAMTANAIIISPQMHNSPQPNRLHYCPTTIINNRQDTTIFCYIYILHVFFLFDA